MTVTISDQFQNWLAKNTALPADIRPGYADSVLSLYDSLRQAAPACLALAGAPGTGKSTLAASLCYLLRENGIAADWLSLDDYYLPKHERVALAGSRHPLFARRGVPGTHNVTLLERHVHSLLNNNASHVLAVPVFDKARDDQLGMDHWRRVNCGLQCLIVEGWCLGAVPQSPEQLTRPVNDMEAREDVECRWRTMVNEYLENDYRRLNALYDAHWFMQAPGWQQVIDWRWQQAQAEQQGFSNRSEVEYFLQPFQRLVLHMQAASKHYDRVIQVDGLHHAIISP